MGSFEAAYGTEMRNLADALCRIDTSGGNEAAGQGIIRETLIEHGFEVFEWTADADTLAAHPSFPPSDELDVDDRPSLGGVLEFGDPDRGPTLVLNGHVDVVPATPAGWTADPFEPQWDGGRLVARGAADMKSQLAACLFAARYLADDPGGIDGRIVVESVAGEEEGGIGAAAAVLDAPYPFDRTAAIVTEPTNRRVVTATEGCLMMRLGIQGREAHAARKDRGVDVLPRFDAARRTFEELESERNAQVSHPRFDRFDAPWPVVIGRVAAGNWASNVAGSLTAEMRIGVAPEETLDAVESQFRNRLDAVVDADDWLRTHPPSFDRFGIQFTSAAIEPDEPVVRTLQTALDDRGIEPTEATGETYGTDARHYIEAGIPTVVWGPGRIEEAHFPDESIDWRDVLQAAAVLADTSRRFLGRDVSTL